MNHVILSGCRPEPLAGYLKALGVLRLVAEQADPDARGAWVDGQFVLQSRLDEAALLAFFAQDYVPTPVITPWNGGSGFWAENDPGLAPVEMSTSVRFQPLRDAIAIARSMITKLGLTAKPEPKAEKPRLLQLIRSTMTDDGLAWFDATLALQRNATGYSALLGSGGNDGNMDFGNNFLLRLGEELLTEDEPTNTIDRLESSILGKSGRTLRKVPMGQFAPGNGGYNAGPGFEADSRTNAWDYILLIEGSMAFAAASVRKLDSNEPSDTVFPFAVRTSAAGFTTSVQNEAGHNEIWLPLWSAPASWTEVAALFREGRSRIGRRPTVTGADFARSIANLGVDRGISEFLRFGFFARKGFTHLAVPLGRWPVATAPTPIAALLDDIDPWIVEVSRATGKETPARVRAAIRALDEAIVANVRPGAGPGDAQRLLLALAEVEASAADSKAHAGLWHPVPALDAGRWLPLLFDDSPEFDLAASLAASLRTRWSAVHRFGARWGWADPRPPPSSRVWRRGPLPDRLLDLMQREHVEATRAAVDGFDRSARWYAQVSSVCAFLEGRTDDVRIAEFARALSLLDWREVHRPPRARTAAPAVFAAARQLVGGAAVTERPAPLPAGWIAAARRDDGPTFTALTWRRLTASGVALRGLHRRSRAAVLRHGEAIEVRRIGAACRFPLSADDRAWLLSSITQTPQEVSE